MERYPSRLLGESYILGSEKILLVFNTSPIYLNRTIRARTHTSIASRNKSWPTKQEPVYPWRHEHDTL